MIDFQKIIRAHIREIPATPQPSDTAEGASEAPLHLDRNENPFSPPYNRYSTARVAALRAALSRIQGVKEAGICLVNRRFEALDLLIRLLCEPGADNVLISSPTDEIYERVAQINGVEVKRVAATEQLTVAPDVLARAIERRTKLIVLASPNNPTGFCVDEEFVDAMMSRFEGVLLLDVSFSPFSRRPSLFPLLNKYPRVVLLDGLSPYWSTVGVGIAALYGRPELFAWLDRLRSPFDVSEAAAEAMLQALQHRAEADRARNLLIEERERMQVACRLLPYVEEVYTSGANFFLMRLQDAPAVGRYLAAQGIFVRSFPRTAALQNCLRITVGTPADNRRLLAALRAFKG